MHVSYDVDGGSEHKGFDGLLGVICWQTLGALVRQNTGDLLHGLDRIHFVAGSAWYHNIIQDIGVVGEVPAGLVLLHMLDVVEPAGGCREVFGLRGHVRDLAN